MKIGTEMVKLLQNEMGRVDYQSALTLNVTRTAGFMDAPYMHSHTTEVIDQNDKATDFTSLWEE